MLQYLLMPLRWLWRLLTISQTLVFGLLGLVILGGLLMAPFSDDAPGNPDRGALVLDLQGVLVEEKTAIDPLELLQSGERPMETHLRSVIKPWTLRQTMTESAGWFLTLTNLAAGSCLTSSEWRMQFASSRHLASQLLQLLALTANPLFCWLPRQTRYS